MTALPRPTGREDRRQRDHDDQDAPGDAQERVGALAEEHQAPQDHGDDPPQDQDECILDDPAHGVIVAEAGASRDWLCV